MEQNTLHSDDPDYLPGGKTLITFSRRRRGRNKTNPQAAAAALQNLTKTLNPIPFISSKSLDLQRHEGLLKRLGLWDFAHIEFDPTLRTDLIAELIINYCPRGRCSYVGEARVMVSRADLARALKLPVERKRKNVGGEEESKESIGFVEDLVGKWVLLKEEEMWGVPRVMEWYKNILEGQFGNVDWAGLIWLMVEKELVKGGKLGDCYYASVLQLLIKSQCEGLFSVEMELKEEGEGFRGGRLEEGGIELCVGGENVEECVHVEEVNVGADDENVGKVDAENGFVDKVDVVEEFVEKCYIEKGNYEKVDSEQEIVGRVGVEQENGEKFNSERGNAEELDVEVETVERVDVDLENVEGVRSEKVVVELEDEDIMDIEEFKEEVPNHWLLAGNDNSREPCLRRCDLDRVMDLGCGNERKNYMELGNEVEEDDSIEEEDQEGGFNLSMEDLSSGSLMQIMEGDHIPLSSGMPLHDHLATEFPSSRWELMLPGSSSHSDIDHKRGFSHKNDNSHHGLDPNKRLKTDGPWHSKMPGHFDMCMEPVQQWMEDMEDIQQWMEKARMMYVAKEQECEHAEMNQQLLLAELQKKDEFIEHLRMAMTEEQQTRQTEKLRFEHEVNLMQNILNGYRKALKASQKAFAEYRARNPQAVEPLYRDVPGSGGLVLSSGQLERFRLKQEEEERLKCLVIETKIKDFEDGWIRKFEAHQKSVEIVSNRLLDVEKEVKPLNEQLTRWRLADKPESTSNES